MRWRENILLCRWGRRGGEKKLYIALINHQLSKAIASTFYTLFPDCTIILS
ncbi:hypothetical protein FDUTEX481_01494 [Tolypothrix sp. PCC 7601]|nr:hypothetical protein FDUTEX481_01494 [Tolypothrix sp. PCC 7601]